MITAPSVSFTDQYMVFYSILMAMFPVSGRRFTWFFIGRQTRLAKSASDRKMIDMFLYFLFIQVLSLSYQLHAVVYFWFPLWATLLEGFPRESCSFATAKKLWERDLIDSSCFLFIEKRHCLFFVSSLSTICLRRQRRRFVLVSPHNFHFFRIYGLDD